MDEKNSELNSICFFWLSESNPQSLGLLKNHHGVFFFVLPMIHWLCLPCVTHIFLLLEQIDRSDSRSDGRSAFVIPSTLAHPRCFRARHPSEAPESAGRQADANEGGGK